MEDNLRLHYLDQLTKRIEKSLRDRMSAKDMAQLIFNEIVNPAVEEEREAWVKMIYDRFEYDSYNGGH